MLHHEQEKSISNLGDLVNQVSPTKPALFTKAIQDAAKVKFKTSETKKQLDQISTTILEGAEIKRSKRPGLYALLYSTRTAGGSPE
ncbi:hypothetical protein DSO57_1014795 [Entomophthora muscae]|uniref:Uncharacterized protein n=1 Tax=Entomophthora muscae TaxID=34485 RepID=A0ACC2URE2_9FUNG|nr:hypothetical protein DSO57_1014795 [Entomophthora muscae]